MHTILMTGFPGFLGTALVPRLLERRGDARVLCLVQERHRALAESRVQDLAAEHPLTAGRVSLLSGDLTERALGLSEHSLAALADVREVWHLAAVYDLHVGEEQARRVNVDGTARVLDLCRSLPATPHLHHVSTCYVSGRHAGEFGEDDLEVGQDFRNHYERTKYDAEVLVRKAAADGLPVTVYRPGIVVGDSQTGATQKYDGPYFLATFLRRQPRVAVVPVVADPDQVRFCLVPRDFVVDAMVELSSREGARGRTYALTDPAPPTVRELVDTFSSHLGRRAVRVPMPLTPLRAVVGAVPGVSRLLGLPAEALEYFASPTTYSTDHTTEDLEGTGVACPPFGSYAGRLLDFMLANPDVDAKAMV